MLRPYQQDAVDAAMAWVRRCVDPIVIGAPTGAGKSHIIADIANQIREMSGKRVLVLAPTGELVKQDYAKYLATGNRASIFSASGGRKETHFPVVFGSPLTVANNLHRFGKEYAAVIVDEAHGLTPTLINIIDHVRGQNPNLRVIGLSATPFRLGTGYIYANHHETGPLSESETFEPYFHTLVYDIDARELIAQGFLTPPVMENPDTHYNTGGLVLLPNGHWDSSTVDAAFEGHGRKTASIVADVVAHAANRRGVMIFAATVKHAEEVMASLPQHLSAIVTGKTPKGERDKILTQFNAQELKYLVNVSVLTTGFDAPHVDVIAILRATESVALLQQIIGRGLRIDAGKTDCLILDYAENLDRHCPDGDVFDPAIRAKYKAEDVAPIEAVCPECSHTNTFSARKNTDAFGIDEAGYFIDPLGQRIDTDYGPMPAHYGRRCAGESMVAGRHVRCEYQWTYKECPECGDKNDIAARYCSKCRAEIVDPNEKLREIAARIASDPYRIRTANVTGWTAQRWPGRDGKPDTLRVTYYIDESPHDLPQWIGPKWTKWRSFCAAAWGRNMEDIDDALSNWTNARKPDTIVYQKKVKSKFFDVKAIS